MSSSNDVQEFSEFSSACRGMLARFFHSFPDEAFQSAALQSLERALTQGHHFDGKPGGWAGGLVHAIARTPGSEAMSSSTAKLEAIFGASMGTIRKRAEQVWPAVESEVTRFLSNGQREFTLRDEANAMCAYAFRNGPIEDIHASVDSDGRPRISDPEMRRLMIEASGKLAKLLEMKAADPKVISLS